MATQWEYRIIRKVYPNEGENSATYLELHEVYHTKGSGKKGNKIISMTDEASTLTGWSVKQLRKQLKQMKKALKKPPLIMKVPKIREEK